MGDKKKPEVAHCDYCGGVLRFDVRDPTGLGRSMQQCANRSCPYHAPHPMPLTGHYIPDDSGEPEPETL